MQTFRQSWSGVTSLLITDPAILPTSNNRQDEPWNMLKGAFPMMTWNQPRNNRRAIFMSSRYMTPPFARELSMYVGCAAEREILPAAEDFVDEAMKPPPLYFETEERTFQGVCCVCHKKGCLGRCPNPSCGLLMHHT